MTGVSTRTSTRVIVAGVGVDPLDAAATRRWFQEAVASQPRPGRRVSTVNLDYLVLADHDAGFAEALRRADLALPDGSPVLWLARLAGHRFPERVAGSDLTAWMLDGGIARSRIFLLGSTPEVCRSVSDRAAAAGAQIAGWEAPAALDIADTETSQAIVERINRQSPDVLLVALGAPRQDLWMARHQPDLDVSVMMGVGGSLDLAAGRLRRAPVALQRAGLEWAYRLAQEPRRLWRRYLLDDLPFLARQGVTVLARRRPS